MHILDYIVSYRPPLGLKLDHWKDKTHISNFTEDHLVNRCRFRHDNEATSWFEFGNTFCQPNMRWLSVFGISGVLNVQLA